MAYYSVLGFFRDPFANTPDPDIYFRCPRQIDSLERLEIGVRLRRGLSIVLGPVGAGKTTLSRQLMRTLSDNPEFDTHLLLDPFFETEKEFLTWLNRDFEIPEELITDSLWQLKDNLKNFLYSHGVEQGKTVCLIVDEGQKITPACLEVLRELLNYETNEFKLLQIVIFAQEEFKDTLNTMPNLADRVYQILNLETLSFKNTLRMIHTRMELCRGEGPSKSLFTYFGCMAVYWATGGKPRKVVQLCHKAILALIAHGGTKVGWSLVWSCTRVGEFITRYRLDLAGLTILGIAAGYLLGGLPPINEWLAKAFEALNSGPNFRS